MRALPLVIVAALASVSCNAVNRFSCETDEQCNVQAGGRCHATEVCTYPSASCPSGYAFDDGTCVLDGVADASEPDASTNIIDGSWPDAQSPSARWVFVAGNARSDRTNPDSPQPMENLVLYVPDGPSSYRNVWTSTEKDWTRSIAWADYDKDGRMDFAAGNGYGNARRNRIYRNEGNDSFVVAWTAPTATFTQAVAWSDVDRDGDLDLLAGTSTGVKVYRQGPATTFTEADLVGQVPMVAALAVADMDGDGDDDLAIGAGSTARIYANNGAGIFSSRWDVSTSTGSSALAWADYDRDGDLDLAVEIEHRLTVYQQTGGSFVKAFDSGIDHIPALDRLGLQGIEWLDFDGDGDLDIATAGLLVPVGSGELVADKQRVFRNAGGSFTVAWESPLVAAYSLSVGDFNNDGAPDLIYGNDGADTIYENTGGSFSNVWGSGTTDLTNAVVWAPFASPQ